MTYTDDGVTYDHDRREIRFEFFDDDRTFGTAFDDPAVVLPGRFEVCGRCRGTGVHDHPAFANGITEDQIDGDPDFLEDYGRGVFDVQCSECHGQRVALVVDEARADKLGRAALDELWAEAAADQAERDAERRMGA